MSKNKNGSGANYNSNSADRSRIDDVTTTAKDKLSTLSSTASTRIDSSPFVALGAGVAVGAVLAAVLPVSQREKEVLGPLGTKLSTAGTEAIDRARDMGRQKFDEMAGEKVREFFGAGAVSSKA